MFVNEAFGLFDKMIKITFRLLFDLSRARHPHRLRRSTWRSNGRCNPGQFNRVLHCQTEVPPIPNWLVAEAIIPISLDVIQPVSWRPQHFRKNIQTGEKRVIRRSLLSLFYRSQSHICMVEFENLNLLQLFQVRGFCMRPL